ncbi:beta family protein [Cellvibrio sp. UBA7661]|uniref:beta family protein n=1 Tax=Cellvibrio sp. UBA7661 TaxID=1946311 RepID=UPI002F3558C1
MYYPNLRWKQGEIKALENAPDEWISTVCPIWIIENPQGVLVDAALGIASVWSGDQILDMSRVDIEDIEEDLYTAVESTNLPFAILPQSVPHLTKNLLKAFSKRPCFRVACPPSLEETLEVERHTKNIDQIKAFAENQNLIVIIDFGFVTTHFVDESKRLAEIVEMYSTNLKRQIIVSGGSFPSTLQDVQGARPIARIEKNLYTEISANISTTIQYSDYATLSPDWSQSEILRSNHINIRYTHDDHWLVLRQRGKDAAAIYELTQLLVLQDEYRGAEFSWADDIWKKRSEEPPQTGPGNSTFHVSEFIHHHIAQVVKYG